MALARSARRDVAQEPGQLGEGGSHLDQRPLALPLRAWWTSTTARWICGSMSSSPSKAWPTVAARALRGGSSRIAVGEIHSPCWGQVSGRGEASLMSFPRLPPTRLAEQLQLGGAPWMARTCSMRTWARRARTAPARESRGPGPYPAQGAHRNVVRGLDAEHRRDRGATEELEPRQLGSDHGGGGAGVTSGPGPRGARAGCRHRPAPFPERPGHARVLIRRPPAGARAEGLRAGTRSRRPPAPASRLWIELQHREQVVERAPSAAASAASSTSCARPLRSAILTVTFAIPERCASSAADNLTPRVPSATPDRSAEVGASLPLP